MVRFISDAAAVIVALAGALAAGGAAAQNGADGLVVSRGDAPLECASRAKRLPSGLKTEVSAAYDLECETAGGERHLADVYKVNVAGAGGGLDAAYLDRSAWRGRLNVGASCDEAEPIAFMEGAVALALTCKMNAGGFPYGAFAVELQGEVYLADGDPLALPGAAAAIAREAGLEAAAAEAATNVGAFAQSLAGELAVSRKDVEEMALLLSRARLANREYDFVSSAEYYRDALALHERVFGEKEAGGFEWHASRADLVIHLANELSNQTRFNDADALFQRAEKLFENGATAFMRAKLKTYQAHHAANRGDRDEALDLAREATGIRREIAAPYLERLDRSKEKDVVLIDRDPAFGDASARIALADVATSENAVGLLLHKRGDTESALLAFERAEFALEKSRTQVAGGRNTAIFRLHLYANWANALVDAGRAREAQRLAREALGDMGPASVGTRGEAVLVFAEGRALAARGRDEQAVARAVAGFNVLKELSANGNYAEIELPRVAFYFETLARAGERSPKGAAPFIAEAFEHAQFVGETSITAKKLIETAYVLQKEREEPAIREAIDAFQAAKARRERLEVDLALLKSEDAMGQDVRLDPAYLDAFTAAAASALERQETAKAALETLFPEYFTLPSSTAAVADVRGKLSAGEALVYYLTGEGRTFAFALGAGDLRLYDVGLDRGRLADVVAELRAPISAGRSFDAALAHRLYTALLGPAETIVSGASQLVIVPDGALLRFPFGLLVSEAPRAQDPQRRDFSDVSFLAKDAPLLVSPSVSAFAALREGAASAAQNPFIGFANSTPPPGAMRFLADTAGRGGARQACGETLITPDAFPPLPETEEEAVRVARNLGATKANVFTREAFTKSRFDALHTRLRDYRVLYFATHGYLPHEFACGQAPGLLLSHETGAGAEDILLTAPEIMNLDINADLVVLSACNTAGGGFRDNDTRIGESLSGLVRAFFHSGARSVVATHWSVPSEASKDLMINAFLALEGSGGNFPQALMAAQTEMIEAGGERSHPFYWAAYTVNGAAPLVKSSVAAAGLGVAQDPALAQR